MPKVSFHYTPAVIVSIVSAGIAVAVSFGAHLTQENTRSIMLLVGLVAGGITIGGAIKSKGMMDAGIHPVQKAMRRDNAEALAAERERFFAPLGAPPPTCTSEAQNIKIDRDISDSGCAPQEPEPRRPHRKHGEDAHPILKAHGTFKNMPLGKNEAKHDPRTPLLAEFLKPEATLGFKLPRATHDLDAVAAELGGDFGMMGNDGYGDCTCAALGHAIQVWTFLATGQAITLTAAQVLALYWATGKQDDGRVMFDVLKYVHHNDLAGHKIGAYVALGLRRYSNRDVKAAIDLFGGCYLGVGLPETAQSQHVWDVSGDPGKPGPAQWGSWGGHAIWLGEYDHQGPTCVTWAHPLKMTWDFLDVYADEGYAIISPDAMRDGKTAKGFDVAALQAYLDKIKQGWQPPMLAAV